MFDLHFLNACFFTWGLFRYFLVTLRYIAPLNFHSVDTFVMVTLWDSCGCVHLVSLWGGIQTFDFEPSGTLPVNTP